MSSDEIKMKSDDPKFRITPTQQTLAACTGALFTSVIVTPLDVVKIRLQTQQKNLATNKCFLFCNGLMDHICPCIPTKSSSHFNGTMDAFVKIARNEGILSLWSGLSPTLVLAVPATVLYFVSYEQLRTRIMDRYRAYGNATSVSARLNQPLWVPLVSGCFARIIAATTVSPIELVRTKMQSKRLSYTEMSIALQSLMKTEGLRGLWKGVGPTLLRDVPFSGIYWVSYETLKSIQNGGSSRVTFTNSFISGSLAGAIAATVTTPFDVVKTFQQIELEIPKKKKTTLDIMRTIYTQSGIKGLFTGLIPRVVKVAPACAIMVSTFEYSKSFFESRNYMNFQLTQVNSTVNQRRDK
ncbi:solute carrier family 25 member 40 isoform X2 [Nilaparvata lugens]|uniref:solute carrier family 25 member 40 isoform X2 n=1 Tax=Nilaparvata lugens TaxID=108931 RepID=UPI00193E3AF3|nr:solute carrier family 25 member 40 isoform X2 [Nilaparvata lugens]